MRRHWLASTGILALLTATSVDAAKAADMPLKAPPLVGAPWSWSGFYLGAHAGFGSARDSFSDPFFAGKVPVTLGGIDPHGFLGGFQAGANWQTGSWVGGLEIDLSQTGIKGTSSVASPTVAGTFDSATQTDRFDLLGSARARVGYLPAPNVLLYGTGGLAWTRFDQTTTSTATTDVGGGTFVGIITATDAPSWRFGWVAGLGAEVRLWDSNWLARLEYLHYDFGDSGNAFATGSTPTTSSHLTTDVVRVGLSYLFGGGLAPVAPAAYSPMVFKAPPTAVAWSWSGFYIGAHVGYGWGNDPQLTTPFDENFDLTPTEPLSGVNSHGGLGGFQAGANWQSRGGWVGGLEIDLSATGIKGRTVNTGTLGTSTSLAAQTDEFDWLGSGRARIGYLVSPSMLLYGTGGLAWTRLDQIVDTVQLNVGGPNTATSTATPSWRFGWVAGIGAEARLWDSNWLARVEYLHYDFGDSGSSSEVDTTVGVVTFNSSVTSGHLTTDVVRAGLSYKLDGDLVAAAAHSPMIYKASAAPVAWSWSGFYLGAHAGYGWGHDPSIIPTSLVIPFEVVNGVDLKGGLVGFQAGANWQVQSWVGGLEIDLSDSGIKGTTSNSAMILFAGAPSQASTATRTDKFDLLGSARARVGYLLWPGTLLYGTGGLAWTRLTQTFGQTETDFVPPFTIVASASTPSWQFGWVAGFGGEVRLADSNWLARLEYLHYDFGNSASSSNTFTETGMPNFFTGSISGRLTNDVVRAALSYKLD